ncbi:IS3 family transposase [Escherichia coli]|uniref:IS3 family transposase n=1 Tax=Escherichia coli TaxID=562 RepID=UPI003EB77C0F
MPGFCNEYIELFYNRQRRHSLLGTLSPVAFRKKSVLRNSSRRHYCISDYQKDCIINITDIWGITVYKRIMLQINLIDVNFKKISHLITCSIPSIPTKHFLSCNIYI